MCVFSDTSNSNPFLTFHRNSQLFPVVSVHHNILLPRTETCLSPYCQYLRVVNDPMSNLLQSSWVWNLFRIILITPGWNMLGAPAVWIGNPTHLQGSWASRRCASGPRNPGPSHGSKTRDPGSNCLRGSTPSPFTPAHSPPIMTPKHSLPRTA